MITDSTARLAGTQTTSGWRFHRSMKTPTNGPSAEYGISVTASSAASWPASAALFGLNSR